MVNNLMILTKIFTRPLGTGLLGLLPMTEWGTKGAKSETE